MICPHCGLETDEGKDGLCKASGKRYVGTRGVLRDPTIRCELPHGHEGFHRTGDMEWELVAK